MPVSRKSALLLPAARQQPAIAAQAPAGTSAKKAASKVAVKKVPAKPLIAKVPRTKPVGKKAARTGVKAPANIPPLSTSLLAPLVAEALRVDKQKKPKLVRDSFTIPKAEYVVLEQLKQRANSLAQPAKKSELLRAGIKALAAMPDAAFQAALQQVPAIKTGRPALEA